MNQELLGKLSNFSLLYAEDEEGIRNNIQEILQYLFKDLYLAKNGEEAFQIFRNVNPPIVLTDIRMPIMDGIDLLQKIKKENTDTEVIIITGHGDMDLAIKSLKYGE